jgi:hypothetical protein
LSVGQHRISSDGYKEAFRGALRCAHLGIAGVAGGESADELAAPNPYAQVGRDDAPKVKNAAPLHDVSD